MQNFHPSMLQEPPKRGGCLMIVLLLIAAIVFTILASCSPRVVRSELRTTHDTARSHRIDTLRLIGHRIDSVIVRDSIFFTPTTANVPAGQMLVKERTRLRLIQCRDTVYSVARDTVYISTRQRHEEKVAPPRPSWGTTILIVSLALLVTILTASLLYIASPTNRQ